MIPELIHINVTAFPIGVERVVDPRLRERPVVVALSGARAVALAVSREAYLSGVKKGMLVLRAKKFCRGLTVIPPNEPLYRRAAQAVFELAANYSPLVEAWRPGHLHLDLTGTRKLFGHPVDTGARIHRELKERLRLRSCVGVASNKLVSRVASRVIRPRGVCDVFHGGEAAFLSPLEVEVLPGVGDKTAERLADFNIQRVGELAVIPAEQMALAFGREGYRLHRSALGIDDSPVRPPDRTPVLREEETLSDDANDDRVILGLLYLLTERAARRLRRLGQSARAVRLEIIYSDHLSAASEKKLPEPADLDRALFAAARELLEKTWTRRLRLRYLALALSDLSRGPRQKKLFGEEELERERDLLAALDAVRQKYGEGAVRYGRTLVREGTADERG